MRMQHSICWNYSQRNGIFLTWKWVRSKPSRVCFTEITYIILWNLNIIPSRPIWSVWQLFAKKVNPRLIKTANDFFVHMSFLFLHKHWNRFDSFGIVSFKPTNWKRSEILAVQTENKIWTNIWVSFCLWMWKCAFPAENTIYGNASFRVEIF